MSNESASAPTAVTPDNLTATLEGMLAALLNTEGAEGRAQAELVKANPLAQQALGAVLQMRPEHFHLFWEYPHTKLTRGLLAAAGIKPFSPLADLFSNYSFYENHFKHVYESQEGGACCADKSRWAMRSLAVHLADGRPIPCERTESSYWIPGKVLNTHESILEFFNALKQLRYGNPELYLRALLAARQTS